MWRKGNPYTVFIGSTTILENSKEIPQKIKNRTTICSSYPTSGYISKGKKSLSQQGICTPMFTAALFTVAKIWRKPKCPLMDEWIKEMCVCVCIHT